jgi:type IV pilus assembly protein PilY1
MSRHATITFLMAALVGLAPALTRADDTDIYVDNQASTPPASQPLVMFSVDYRSNLGSTICTASSRPCNVDTFFIGEGFAFTTRADGVTKVLASPADGEAITFFDVLRLSLRLVLRETRGYKAGLMLNHNHENNCAGPQSGKKCSNGGYIARRFRSINSVVLPNAVDTDPSRVELLTILDSLPATQGNLSHSYQGTELFFEFFRYLTGQLVYNGTNGWTDYATNSTNNLCLRPGDLGSGDSGSPCLPTTDPTYTHDFTFAGRDTQAATGGAGGERTYNSPLLESDACTKIFTINFLFQVSNNDNDSNSDIDNARNAGGLGITIPNSTSFQTTIGFLRDVDLAPETNKFNSSLSWTFPDDPATTDVNEQQTLGHLPGVQNVTSFFIARPTPEPSTEDSSTIYQFDKTTEDYAILGGTERPLPLSKDPAVLVNAIRSALQQILSVSTTLVAASVPVNVFNRSEIVDNVYFALFQAQGAGSPAATNVPGGAHYWPGNLKKLRLGTNATGRPEIQDVNNQPAIAALDGRILTSALTFWTDPSGAFMNAGDRNSDGSIDSTDSDADGVGNDFTPPYSGTAANPADYITDRDGRAIARGGAGQKIPGFVDTATGPGDTNPTGETTATGARKLFYLTHDSAAASLAALNADNTTAGTTLVKAQLGNAGMATADALRLLKYARGQDINDEDDDANTAESRYWIQGDPLHSRPLPLNYGALATAPTSPQKSVAFDLGHKSQSNPAIFIAMASNDGYLRMFRNTGGTTTSTDAIPQLGREVWAFMPPEGLAVQQQLANQTAPTGFPSHAYSFDGEPSALVIDQDGDGVIECNNTCDRGVDDSAGTPGDDLVILYIGLRRGQSKYNVLDPSNPLADPVGAYYAIDVTEPLNPKFLWRIAPGSRTVWNTGADLSTEFGEMGQTFSRPRLGLVKTATNPDGTDVRVLAMFFGGGYHGGYAGNLDAAGEPERLGNDIDGAMADDPKGNAIYVVRANTGQLLWKATQGSSSPTATNFQHPGLKDSIPSNITTVDSNADGVVDRLYVGDTGGTLWRADLGPDTDSPTNGTRDDWKVSILAKLGRHAYANPTDTANRINDRRFFHEPDVIQARDATGRFDAVVIGSGDRENPLDQGPTTATTTTDANGVTTTTVTRTSIDVDNWFYMIKDRNIGIGGATDSTRTHDSLTDITNRCISGASLPCEVNTEGWRLAMDNPNGEKALSAPVTIANSIFFTTYVPPPPGTTGLQFSCGPKEGSGFLYAVSLLTGAPARDYNSTDGPTNADGSGTTDDDRDKKLDTPGIPAQVVYLGSPATTTGGDRCVVNILAGAQVFEAPGCPRFRTFWERHGQ